MKIIFKSLEFHIEIIALSKWIKYTQHFKWHFYTVRAQLVINYEHFKPDMFPLYQSALSWPSF